MATSATTIRLDNELKEKLTKELSVTGLSINAYFNMAARQLILQKKIPFCPCFSGGTLGFESSRSGAFSQKGRPWLSTIFESWDYSPSTL